MSRTTAHRAATGAPDCRGTWDSPVVADRNPAPAEAAPAQEALADHEVACVTYGAWVGPANVERACEQGPFLVCLAILGASRNALKRRLHLTPVQ